MALTKIGKEGITGISNASDATFLTATSAEGVTLAGTLAVTGAVTASDDMNFNSGYGSAVTAYGCRAWVNLNGTGTAAIRDSGNVGSITDNGTGNYTVTFAVDMPDVNYAVTGLASSTMTGRTASVSPHFSGTYSVSATQFLVKDSSDNTIDTVHVSIAAVR